jgi:hypothetical protein
MSDMKLIMENWRKFSESEEEINEVIEPMTLAAIAMLGVALQRPPNIHQGVYIGPKLSLLSFSLKELIAMAGLGALARGGVGGKLKSLWNKLRGAEPEAAEEVSDSLDAITNTDEVDPDIIQSFLASVGNDPGVERALTALLALVDSGEAKEEDIQSATDAVNQALAAVAETNNDEDWGDLTPGRVPLGPGSEEGPDGRRVWSKNDVVDLDKYL